MKKFLITVTETQRWQGVVEADTEQEARAKAQRILDSDGHYKFDQVYGDRDGYQIAAVEPTQKPVNVVEDAD